ncbi:endonuclease domain-containing protein [Hymenobacter gummosus]|uniref:Endonuclease domain-containing protein n=1 Tax=Hymenobacter gummosus TaxID=1776032 RepID=A0A3S0JC52_9BACT|nr:endonuclease domain-containing protein [Hymenobacter gummosus]RTQ47235.1 endonuclease domain-containing protein [Hymenobacter gummosus]
MDTSNPKQDRLTADLKRWHTRLKPFSGEMRRNPTPAEDTLWQALRNRQLNNVKFRRQHAIGHFIVDFLSTEHQLIIEVDGEVHAGPSQAEYHEARSYRLATAGYRVLRFPNEQALTSLPTVLQAIREALASLHQ